MKAIRPTEKQKAALYDRFTTARLSTAQEAITWYEDVSEEYGVEPLVVRRWIAQMDEMYRAALQEAMLTDAQRHISTLGPGKVRAIETLMDQLDAKSSKVIHNRDGEVSQTLEFPDNQARIAAAKEILKLTGSYPAEEHVIKNPKSDLNALSDDEINERIAQLRGLQAPAGTGPASGEEGAPGNQ